MDGVEKKSHYLGEILVIMILQVIMLLFRLVEPIHCENLFPGQYTHFMNDFAYFGIEFIFLSHCLFTKLSTLEATLASGFSNPVAITVI